MQFCTLLATFALSYAAPIDTREVDNFGGANQNAFLQGAHDSMVNAQQVQDTLNNQIKNDPAHANEDRISAYITGADSQIDNAIATTSRALAPFTGGLSEKIGNVLLGPFVQSVTNGAEVMLANMVGGAEDRASAQRYARLTGDYSRLAELAVKNNVPADKLINLNKQMINRLPKDMQVAAMKREVDNFGGANQNAYLQGAHDSMVNAQQVQDTLNNQIKNDPAHANEDRISAYITGADSQIDNAIATTSRALAPFTGDLSEKIGNVLLGPFVQSVTNGAEVMLANMVGGAEDRASAEQYARITGDYSRLADLAVKNTVPADKLINLNKQIQNRMPKN